MRYCLYSWVGRILFFWWYLLYFGVEYWARPVMRDDASIVPYKSLFLFAAKFYLSSPSIHFLPLHHTKNAHSARYLSALCAFC